MAASAHTFVVIADDSKQSKHLGEKVEQTMCLFHVALLTNL